MTLNSLERSAFLAPFSHFPTPFHVYNESHALEDAKALSEGLRHFLPTLELYFSTKTNSLVSLLKAMLAEGWGLEVVCPGDRQAAILAGAKGSQLLMNGPAWSATQLADAIFAQEVGQITLDSPAMANLLATTLNSHSKSRPPLKVAFRIHDGNSHFGFPPNLELIKSAIAQMPAHTVSAFGLHIHRNPPSSVGHIEEIADDFRTRAEILSGLAQHIHEITFLDLGGGIDSPWVYRPSPSELGDFHHPVEAESIRRKNLSPRFALKDAGHKVSAAVRACLGTNLARWQVQMEPGRAVCTRALSTVVEVQSVKKELYPGSSIVITDGNTAILGPLHRGVHPIIAEIEGFQNTFVYGNLPHSADWLFQGVKLPELKIGDRLLIKNTGAYFLALEANFGHARPGIYSEEMGLVVRTPETDLDSSLRDKF